MAIRIAINGFGRIGRNVFRIIQNSPGFEVVSINDITTPRRWRTCSSTTRPRALIPAKSRRARLPSTVDGKKIQITAERDPANLPHAANKIDFVSRPRASSRRAKQCMKHIDCRREEGAPDRSAEGRDRQHDRDGRQPGEAARVRPHHLERVLHDELPGAHREGARRLRSASSHGLMTTVHAYTNDQRIHWTCRTATCAARALPRLNIIPTSTGAARAVGKILPKLARASWTAARCACRPGRLRGRPRGDAEEEGHRSRSVNAAIAAAAKKGDSRASSSTPRTRSSRATSSVTRTARSSTPSRRW